MPISRSTTRFPTVRAAATRRLDGVTRAYGGGFADYARNELGFKTEMTYTLLANDVSGAWDWHGGRYQTGTEDDMRTLRRCCRSRFSGRAWLQRAWSRPTA